MNSSKNTFKTAFGGICLAFTVVAVFMASIIPGLELTFYAVSSVFTAAVIIESGIKSGFMLYGASCVLCFILIPDKAALIPFVFFFGIYGVIKFLAEKARNPFVQIIIKTLFFMVIFGSGFFFFKSLFFGNISLPDYSLWVLIPGSLLIFILYDYIYTLMIKLYRQRIKRDQKGIKLS
ncbi:MAG TPA: hypothetical protein PLM92_01865 [Bacillota bacterium]|nr:hypothetical protein [Bacillota bacterium]HUM56150.1 hypothetical protein [Bacillota bacterium]